MNIFLFHSDLAINAELFYKYDKKRFNKQVVEMGQLIAISAMKLGLTRLEPYKPEEWKSIVNHPASKWVYQNESNHQWSIEYTMALGGVIGNSHGTIKKMIESNLPRGGENYIAPTKYLCLCNGDHSKYFRDTDSVYDKYFMHLLWKKINSGEKRSDLESMIFEYVEIHNFENNRFFDFIEDISKEKL